MPKVSPGKVSFNAGVFGPLLEGRIDHQKKAASLRAGVNVVAVTQGPAIKRSSTSFVQPVRDESKITNLVPFVFSDEQALQLEFSDLKLRFFGDPVGVGDAGIVTLTPSAISSITTASPFVFVSAALLLVAQLRMRISDHLRFMLAVLGGATVAFGMFGVRAVTPAVPIGWLWLAFVASSAAVVLLRPKPEMEVE